MSHLKSRSAFCSDVNVFLKMVFQFPWLLTVCPASWWRPGHWPLDPALGRPSPEPPLDLLVPVSGSGDDYGVVPSWNPCCGRAVCRAGAMRDSQLTLPTRCSRRQTEDYRNGGRSTAHHRQGLERKRVYLHSSSIKSNVLFNNWCWWLQVRETFFCFYVWIPLSVKLKFTILHHCVISYLANCKLAAGTLLNCSVDQQSDHFGSPCCPSWKKRAMRCLWWSS